MHYSLIGEPELLDVIDDDWLRACLPDDGALPHTRACTHAHPSPRKFVFAYSTPRTSVTEFLALSPDVPMPEGVPPPTDDHEELRTGVHSKSPEKWGELALQSIY